MAKRWYYLDEQGNKVATPQYKVNSQNHYTKAETDALLSEKADDKVTFYDLSHQEQKEGTVAEGVLTNSFSIFAVGNYIEQIEGQVAGKADKSEINTEVYVGTGTPPTEAKIAIDPAEDLVEIVQEVGSATDKVMSQKAVTDLIGNVEQLLASI